MSKILDKVTELVIPILEKNDCELWGVEYVKEAGTRYLRIFIDRIDGVSINHCEAVSKELDPLLDEIDDMFPESYTFEVSSAGVERLLRGPKDFKRFEGQYVEVKLYKAKDFGIILKGKKAVSVSKSYLGDLKNWDDSGVEIDIDGTTYKFDKPEVAAIRLRLR